MSDLLFSLLIFVIGLLLTFGIPSALIYFAAMLIGKGFRKGMKDNG
jgi:hypothetical protein